MNEDVKRKWVEALRSGEYRQGKYSLRREDRLCCLGVLCQVFKKEEGRGDWVEGIGDTHFLVDGDSDNNFPPFPVHTWSGIALSRLTTLASLNDWGKSFDEIADYIEENL